MKTGLIVQAQLTADTKLRDDILFEKLGDITVLEKTVQQVLNCDNVDEVYVISSLGNYDECIRLDYLKHNNIKVYLKKDNSFVKSIREVINNENLDIIVRVIGNNSFVSSDIIDSGINSHKNENVDYTSYCDLPIGLCASEIVSAKSMQDQDVLTNEDIKVKNITKSIKDSNKFKKFELKNNKYDMEFKLVRSFSIDKTNILEYRNILENGQRINDLSKTIDLYQEKIRKISKIRWKDCSPDGHLTWGKELTGDNFIQKVSSCGAYGKNKNILEVGPGYGRLLKACLNLNIEFNNYYGLDISEQNVKFLENKFGKDNIKFINGDVENFTCNEKFDVVQSSLTFKHFYPTFEKAIKNITKYVNKGGMFFIDFIEKDEQDILGFEQDHVTFVHSYNRKEITDIFNKAGLKIVGFDSVLHDVGFKRLLAIGKKE